MWYGKAERDKTASEREDKFSKEAQRVRRYGAYCKEHSFAPDTVAAFAHEHPQFCHERLSRKGNRVLSYIDYLGEERCCPVAKAGRTFLYGYDATQPGSFQFAIDAYLRAKGVGNPSLKGEEEEGVYIAEKHDIGEASLDIEAHATREASAALDNPPSIKCYVNAERRVGMT